MRRGLIGVGAAIAVLGAGVAAYAAGHEERGTATLRGANEVPVRMTGAKGQAVFRMDEGGLCYVLKVNRIRNVVQSHIHLGPVGVNGPIVVFLYGPVPAAGGKIHGTIATGCVDSDDLIGPLLGKTLDDLLMEMEAGNTYVNVHTSDGVGDPNSGPGDFPGGEIRGQIGHDSMSHGDS